MAEAGQLGERIVAVIDNGSANIRSGFALEQEPVDVSLNVVGD